MDIDKVDIEILYVIFINEGVSPMKSLEIKTIIDKTDLKSSYFTINRRINKKLLVNGYLLEGYKVGNSRSYYLSPLALDYLRENILDKEDIYDYVEDVCDYEEENNEMEEN